MNNAKVGILFLFSLYSFVSTAEITLPKLYSNKMILQRGHAIPVYGRADSGKEVTVTFIKQSRRVTASKDGFWKVEFPALPAGGPFTMLVTDGISKKIIRDIMIGDVWLCSGQSNMVFQLRRTHNLKAALADCDYPGLRVFNVWKNWQLEPAAKLKNGFWLTSAPKRIGNFSAVAWSFGRELHKKSNFPYSSCLGSVLRP